MHFWLPLTSTALFHLSVIFGSLLLYAVSTHVNMQRRHPSAAVAWVITIVLLPYIALPLYLLLGNRKIARPPRRHRAAVEPRVASDVEVDVLAHSRWAIDTIEGMGLAAPIANDEVRFHADGGDAWRELIRVICAAEHRLDICIYLFGHADAAQQIGQLLEERAAAGVRVRLLLDTFGGWQTSRSQLRELRASGVGVRWFMPLFDRPRPGRLNMRNHRKIVVADGRLLWCGGRNLATEYFFRQGPDTPAWLDLSFTLEGPLAVSTQQLFAEHWRNGRAPLVSRLLPRRTRRRALARARAAAVARANTKADSGAVMSTWDATRQPTWPLRPQQAQQEGSGQTPVHRKCSTSFRPLAPVVPRPAANPSKHLAQLVPSGPDQHEDTVYALLLTAMFRARRRVLCVTPYFVPDEALLKAMRLAAQRGVRVELIVPLRSNHWLADISRGRALYDLATAGAEVRLMSQMSHAKVVVIDDALALAGSMNLDARSLFLSFELMIAFYSPTDIETLTNWVDRTFATAQPYQLRQRTLGAEIGEGLVRWLGFQI